MRNKLTGDKPTLFIDQYGQWISEGAALAMLRRADYAESNARIILSHSLQKDMFGATYYPLKYIAKRCADYAARNRERDA